MRPPFEITPEIITLITSVAEKLGQINAKFLDKPAPKLRKENRIKTIYASLSIEGNTLTEEQITALIEDKRVIGPEKDVNEVLNAIQVYEELNAFNPLSSTSFLKAHARLMKGLIADAGKYRKTGVGIMAGDKLAHMAPPAQQVPHLMNALFAYLKNSKDITLIKSCVFHYELEFIHPFSDGNGRMGRLWQTRILMESYPVFEFIPFENIIHQTQDDYYRALALSDNTGRSTPFILYMMEIINRALSELLDFKGRIMTSLDRINYFSEITQSVFTRKDYMNVFKELSTATASRDLKLGVELGIWSKTGDKTKTVYFKAV